MIYFYEASDFLSAREACSGWKLYAENYGVQRRRRDRLNVLETFWLYICLDDLGDSTEAESFIIIGIDIYLSNNNII